MCLLIMCHVSLCDVGARKQKADSSKAASTEALLAEDTSECDTVPAGRSQGDKVWEYVTEVCACSVRVRLALLCVCFRGKKWREKQMKSPGPWIDLWVAEFILFSKFLVVVFDWKPCTVLWKRQSQLTDCSDQTGLPPCLWEIVWMVIDVRVRYGWHTWAGRPGLCKKASWAWTGSKLENKPASNAPLVSMSVPALIFLSDGVWPGSVSQISPFPSQFLLVRMFYHSHRSQSRMVLIAAAQMLLFLIIFCVFYACVLLPYDTLNSVL